MLVYNQGEPEEGVYTLFVEVSYGLRVLMAQSSVPLKEPTSICIVGQMPPTHPPTPTLTPTPTPALRSLPVHVLAHLTVGFASLDP